MTKEEAIKELELIAQVTMWNERRLAVEMAIEALQQDPVTYTFDVKSDKCEECAYKKTVEELSKGFEDYIIHGERRDP